MYRVTHVHMGTVDPSRVPCEQLLKVEPGPHINLQTQLQAMALSPFWTVGCIYGASAVIFGAFGAHGLKKHIADPQRIANWSTAAHYQVAFRRFACRVVYC